MERKEPPSQREEPVVIPIEDSLDLHSFSPKEVKEVVAEYLFQCSQKGYGEVRIIHGRGTGIQRQIVRSLLTKSPLVNSFTDAPPASGGWGATIVFLKSENSIEN